MKLFIVFICLGIILATPARADEDPMWFPCLQDADCVIVGDGCFTRGVNKTSETPASTYFMDRHKTQYCAFSQPKEKAHPVCVQQCIQKKFYFFGPINVIDGSKCNHPVPACKAQFPE